MIRGLTGNEVPAMRMVSIVIVAAAIAAWAIGITGLVIA